MTPHNFPYASVYPEYPFAVMGIDKIALGIDYRYLTTRASPAALQQIIDIITYGNYSILNFQGEFIDTNFPLRSIAHLLIKAAYFGIFEYHFANYLVYHCNMFLYGFNDASNLVYALFAGNVFKWDELEIYFDIYGEMLPLQINNRRAFININGTLYTKDYKMLYRKAYNPDGSSYRQKKGVVRSILALYDRGKRLDTLYPNIQHGNITRLEVRICDKKAKAILNPDDLCLSLEDFIDKNGNVIMRKITKAHLSPQSITFDCDFVDEYIPCLPQMLNCEYHSGISSSKQQIFPEKRKNP
ncbi:MAG: hypothetical protein LBR68_00050 [Lachnoclostridium sp.]|jgi:hypothetical protein|nr:hypothetical protein [Lachnoclostridium sp.]